MTTRRMTRSLCHLPRAAAQQLWELGANITAIAADSKQPTHRWDAWQTERQTLEVLNGIQWNGKKSFNGSKPIPAAQTVGIISGINGWRCLDIDARVDDQGRKQPVPIEVIQAVLDTFDLPATYPWYGRSRSGAGWHLWLRCEDDLPTALDQASKSGKESGIKVGLPAPDYTGHFDHLELRWERCQTVLPAPDGYTGTLPERPPALVRVEQVAAAFLAIASPQPSEPPRPPPQTPPVTAQPDRYAAQTLAGCLAELAAARNGTRNTTLNRCAFRVAQFVGAGRLSDDSFDQLAEVAQGLGLPEQEIAATLRSARAGLNAPAYTGLPQFHRNGNGHPLRDTVPLAISDQAKPHPHQTRFPLETLADLAALPPTVWLIPERIPADNLTLLYGPSESGKSFIALHWALTIALKYPDRAVIYVAPEGGTGYQKRAAAWLQHWKKATPPNLLFLRAAPRLGDPHDLHELIATITPQQPIFVVLDTLARCAIELDENSARDMGVFIDACDAIRRATGAAVLPVHHSGKDARNGARGSSALRAAVDMAHEVQRDGELVTLTCDKSKDIAKPEPIFLRMVEVAESVVMLPATSVVRTHTGKLQANERAVLEALALDVFDGVGASARKLVEVAGVPEGSLYRVLSGLKRRGYVSQAARGDPYAITSTGRTAISDYQATINTGASWSPDNDDPTQSPSGPRGRDSGDTGDSWRDSSQPELAPEYGAATPNYHAITEPDDGGGAPSPERADLDHSTYHPDSAVERPPITSITDYHAPIDSESPALASSRLSLDDSRDDARMMMEQAMADADTDIEADLPPHDAALLALAETPQQRQELAAQLAQARTLWLLRGPNGVWWYLHRTVRVPYREAACTTWLEAEKAAQLAAQRDQREEPP